MDENEITQRLRDAGDQPVPGEVRATHLSQMHAAVPVVEKPKRFGRLAVAAAAFVGFAVGSTGFAMAGALPAPAQGVAHDVLSVVQFEVPDRPDNRGKCVSEIANNPDLTPEQKKIDKANCEKGKPAHAEGRGKRKGKANGGGPPDAVMNDNNPCKGPPPWAGKGDKAAKADKAAQREEHRAARVAEGCAADADDLAEAEAEAREEQQEREAEALEKQGEQEAPPAPAEQAPADPGAAGNAPPAGDPGAQGQGDGAPELPAPLVPDAGSDAEAETDAGADVEAQDTDPLGD